MKKIAEILLQKVDSRRIPQGDVESKSTNLDPTETFTQFFRRQSSLSQAQNSILEAYFASQTHQMSQASVKPRNHFKSNSSTEPSLGQGRKSMLGIDSNSIGESV